MVVKASNMWEHSFRFSQIVVAVRDKLLELTSLKEEVMVGWNDPWS